MQKDEVKITKPKLHFKRNEALGKYRLLSKLGVGGFCEVWKARDRVEGIDVALKIPLISRNGERDSQTLLHEVKLVANLRHPNILPVKNADIVNGYAIMATELGQKTLEKCSRPMSAVRIISIVSQVLSALRFAHRHRVIHCDVTPGNIFLFPDGRAALGDFGIGLQIKGRMVTIDEYGTPGYVAPEQAYGKPTVQSDCFAVGLILYEYLTGILPGWPYRWPFRGHDRLRQKTSYAFAQFLKRAIHVDPKHRFASAADMLEAMTDALPRHIAEKLAIQRSQRKKMDWQKIRRAAFKEKYQRVLAPLIPCKKCGEPISETMANCPWCGTDSNTFQERTSHHYYCPRCKKGMRPEWSYCPWCYGPGYEPFEDPKLEKVHYQKRCRHCNGKLMRFMHYCPWCQRKVHKPWQVRPFPEICGRCKWSVDSDYWSFCPWCHQNLTS